eukprot:94313_1
MAQFHSYRLWNHWFFMRNAILLFISFIILCDTKIESFGMYVEGGGVNVILTVWWNKESAQCGFYTDNSKVAWQLCKFVGGGPTQGPILYCNNEGATPQYTFQVQTLWKYSIRVHGLQINFDNGTSVQYINNFCTNYDFPFTSLRSPGCVTWSTSRRNSVCLDTDNSGGAPCHSIGSIKFDLEHPNINQEVLVHHNQGYDTGTLTCSPTRSPTPSTNSPSKTPSKYPTKSPSKYPTKNPSKAPSKNPSLMPSTSPSTNPSNHPSKNPSMTPTLMPTMQPTLPIYEIDYINGKLCNNLAESTQLYYDVTLNECINHCRSYKYDGTNCTMINYFYYFKNNNDSRCYIFDKICNIQNDINENVNRSMILYKRFYKQCIDYPNDWTDMIGDSCFYYTFSNWCNNGNILKTENEFNILVDTKYGLTAIQACCECGGGVNIFDNVQLSVDNDWVEYEDDVLCSTFTQTDFISKLTQNMSMRDWDNLILYDLCNHFDDLQCEYLLNSNIGPNIYLYDIFMCDYDKNTIDEQIQFIFDIVVIDDI